MGIQWWLQGWEYPNWYLRDQLTLICHQLGQVWHGIRLHIHHHRLAFTKVGMKCTSDFHIHLQSLHKSLGDLVCTYPIKCMGLQLCKLTTPPMIALTSLQEMSLADMQEIFILSNFRYSVGAISLIPGRQWSTVSHFFASATIWQPFEVIRCCGRPYVLIWRQQ